MRDNTTQQIQDPNKNKQKGQRMADNNKQKIQGPNKTNRIHKV